jgi:hypothetical protein
MSAESPSLVELQRRMAAHIAAHAEDHQRRDATLEGWLSLPANVDPAERLRVYGNGYPARLLEALEDAFPAVAVILGKYELAQLAQRYFAAADLSRATLNDAGAQLPAHCRTDPIAARLPFLADLAELEWRVLCAFHAREAAAVDARSFAAWDMDDWERAVLRFQPSLAVIESRWPIYDLWNCRDTPRDQIDLDLVDRPQTVLVHRDGLDVACRVIDAGEAAALDSFLAGATLAETVERLAARDAEPRAVMSDFAAWIGSGLITAVTLRDPD